MFAPAHSYTSILLTSHHENVPVKTSSLFSQKSWPCWSSWWRLRSSEKHVITAPVFHFFAASDYNAMLILPSLAFHAQPQKQHLHISTAALTAFSAFLVWNYPSMLAKLSRNITQIMAILKSSGKFLRKAFFMNFYVTVACSISMMILMNAEGQSTNEKNNEEFY